MSVENKPDEAELPPHVRALLLTPAYATLVTLGQSGAPHATLVWVDTDGQHIVINTVEGRQKLVNMRRDPRVAITVTDPDAPARYVTVEGRVVEILVAGAAEHIHELSLRYVGTRFGGEARDRVMVRIAPTRILDQLRR